MTDNQMTELLAPMVHKAQIGFVIIAVIVVIVGLGVGLLKRSIR